MHSVLLLMPMLVFLPLLLFAVPVIIRLLRPCKMADITPEWLESFQASNYHPMRGLLAVDDFEFLSRQPGFDSSLQRKLRSDRLRIFKQYLNRLISDYNRLHRVAILLISQTKEDNSDLFIRLIKLRLRFSLAVLQVEFYFILCHLGLQSLPVSDLLARFDELASQLASLPKSGFAPVNL